MLTGLKQLVRNSRELSPESLLINRHMDSMSRISRCQAMIGMLEQIRHTARLELSVGGKLKAAPLAPVSFMRGHRFARKCSKRASASAAADAAGSRSNSWRTWGITCPRTPCAPNQALLSHLMYISQGQL